MDRGALSGGALMSFDLFTLLKWAALVGALFFVWAYVVVWTIFDPSGGVFGILFALALSGGSLLYLRHRKTF